MNSPIPLSQIEPAWRQSGHRYYSYNYALRQRFGERIQRVSVDAGFTCPNVDGTVAVGGCNFCDNRSFSPSRRLPRQSIREQIDEGIRNLQRRYMCRRFLAYFQPATNTYAPVERLERVYREALAHPAVVGLAIGTRPDCLPDDVLELITALAAETYLSIELGIQSIHAHSLAWMNRGHGYREVPAVIERCRGRGFEIGAHVILGLPHESRDEMRATAREMARLRLDSIKIHNLYVVKGTPLADEWAKGTISLLTRDDYIQVLIDFLEQLPPTTVVERISGDAPGDYFVAPAWSLDKVAILRELGQQLQHRQTWQGKHYCP